MTLPKGYTSEDKYCNDPECEQNRKGIKHKFHGRKNKESWKKTIIAPILFVLVILYVAIPPRPLNAVVTPFPSDWCNLVLGQSGQSLSYDIQQVCQGVDTVFLLIFIIVVVTLVIQKKIKPKDLV